MFVYNRRFWHGGQSASADRRRTAGVSLQSMPALASLTSASEPGSPAESYAQLEV